MANLQMKPVEKLHGYVTLNSSWRSCYHTSSIDQTVDDVTIARLSCRHITYTSKNHKITTIRSIRDKKHYDWWV